MLTDFHNSFTYLVTYLVRPR